MVRGERGGFGPGVKSNRHSRIFCEHTFSQKIYWVLTGSGFINSIRYSFIRTGWICIKLVKGFWGNLYVFWLAASGARRLRKPCALLLDISALSSSFSNGTTWTTRGICPNGSVVCESKIHSASLLRTLSESIISCVKLVMWTQGLQNPPPPTTKQNNTCLLEKKKETPEGAVPAASGRGPANNHFELLYQPFPVALPKWSLQYNTSEGATESVDPATEQNQRARILLSCWLGCWRV